MKKTLALLLLAGAVALSGAQVLPEQLEPRNPRRISVGAKPVLEMVKNGQVNFEIVVPADAAPTAKFAGKEAAELLGKAFGTKFKVLTAPSGKCPAIVIGSPKFAAKLGADVAKFDRDGFIIKTFPKAYSSSGGTTPKRRNGRRWPITRHFSAPTTFWSVSPGCVFTFRATTGLSSPR